MHITTLKRLIANIVLVTFTSLTLQPLQAVAQAKLAQAGTARTETAQGTTQSPSIDEQYATLLDQIRESVKRSTTKASKGASIQNDTNALRSQIEQLQTLDGQIDASFAATEADLIAKHLPAEILDRHHAAVADFNARRSAFKQQLNVLDKATINSATQINGLNTLANWLDQNQGKKPLKTDPNKLPFRNSDAKARPPIDSEAGYKAKLSLLGIKPVHLAGPIPSGGIRFTQSVDPKAPPTAADLAETIDVQLTPAIRAKAAEFGNHPVQIHNWVRNNIEFIPTYGSIQGSDMTLQTKRGNAFDTASLEIALMRAAGIPARYVYGTIEIPVEKVMNWAGGLTKPEAALTLLAQGGIPSIGLYTGGKITTVRMEHVWVEAYVDWVPSRGADNKHPTTWVPMDGSFKQYTYTQGMDIKNNVPMDAQALLTQAQAGATVNETEGWVQGVNQANLQTALAQYQAQVKTYVDSQKPNATVGDVLGTKTINPRNYSILAGTLPYKRIATAAKLSELPDMLRHKFQYSLYASDYDRSLDNPVFSYTEVLPNLAGKKMTLSYVPATQADADLLASYLPKPHADGSPIQASEFPTRLPGYLLHVVPQLKVEGKVVATGGVFGMGTQLVGQGGFTQYDFSDWDLSTDGTLVAGQSSAIGLSLQGISRSQIIDLKTRLQQTQAQIQMHNLTDLSIDSIAGDVLTTNVWSYFALLESVDRQSMTKANMIAIPGLSYGLLHGLVAANMMFGVPISVRFPGLLMDIGHLRNDRIAKDGNAQTWISYNRGQGAVASTLEGAIPEKILNESNPNAKAVGISATKAIAAAASEGQKIFRITQATAAVDIPQLQQSANVVEDVQNAISAGKEVLISQSPVGVGGWTGVGYIVVDPSTGAGSYMIDGGANGGFAKFLYLESLSIASISLIGLLGAMVGPAGLLAAGLIDLLAVVAIISVLVMILTVTIGDVRYEEINAQTWLALNLMAGVLTGGVDAVSESVLASIGIVLAMVFSVAGVLL